MKIILITFLFSFFLFGAKIDDFASQVKYFRDYDTAFLKAKEENKPLMLVIVEEGCVWCKKFERKVLANKEVKQKVLNTVAVIVDQKYEKKSVPKKYRTTLFPTVVFIDTKTDKQFYKYLGYIKKNNFLYILKNVQAKYE